MLFLGEGSGEDAREDVAAVLLWCEKGAHRSYMWEKMIVRLLTAMQFNVSWVNACEGHLMMQRCQNPTKPPCPECREDHPEVEQLLDKAVSEFFEVALAIDDCISKAHTGSS